jgi:Pyruvate/2-oxoacid:ferredoxin oxidoreductase gamma subunit
MKPLISHCSISDKPNYLYVSIYNVLNLIAFNGTINNSHDFFKNHKTSGVWIIKYKTK